MKSLMELGELDRAFQSGLSAGWRASWRHKLTFVLTALGVFGAIMLAILAIRPMYEGATLLIGRQGSLEAAADLRRPVETTQALVQIAESEEVIVEAIKSVGLQEFAADAAQSTTSIFERLQRQVFPAVAGPERSATAIDAILPRVKRRLSVKGEPNSDVVRIAYRHHDPVIAAKFANAMATALAERQVLLYSRPQAVDFFLKQQKQFEDETKKAAEELDKFSARSAIYAAYDQQQLLLKRFHELSTQLAVVRGTIAQKTGERQALADQLRKLSPVARSPYMSSLVDNLGGEGTGSSSRSKPPGLVDDKTPPLLLVRVYQDTMVALFKTNADLVGAEDLKKQQTQEITKLTAELNTLSQNEREFTRLKRAVDRSILNADIYSKRMVEEKINAESRAAQLSSVKIMQPALVPLRPVSPNYILFGLAGALASALAGVLGALAHSRARPLKPALAVAVEETKLAA